MKKYRVACNNTEHFSILVKAESEEQALSKAFSEIDENGVPEDAVIFDRDFNTETAEELKNI